MKNLLIAGRVLLFTTVLFGLIYPVVVTGIVQVIWPHQANGNIVNVKSQAIGSRLLAQSTTNLKYFWPRPSAVNYQTVASGASNAAATNKNMVDAVQLRREQFAHVHQIMEDEVPAEMIFTSASGLDPHISLQSALMQVKRISQARGFNESQQAQLKAIVAKLIEPPQLGFLGNERINVLLLNTNLDLI